MDAHRKRYLKEYILTSGDKREGAYGCCLDLIVSQNTSKIAKLRTAPPGNPHCGSVGEGERAERATRAAVLPLQTGLPTHSPLPLPAAVPLKASKRLPDERREAGAA